jgi:hypothetical protein
VWEQLLPTRPHGRVVPHICRQRCAHEPITVAAQLDGGRPRWQRVSAPPANVDTEGGDDVTLACVFHGDVGDAVLCAGRRCRIVLQADQGAASGGAGRPRRPRSARALLPPGRARPAEPPTRPSLPSLAPWHPTSTTATCATPSRIIWPYLRWPEHSNSVAGAPGVLTSLLAGMQSGPAQLRVDDDEVAPTTPSGASTTSEPR